MVGCDGVLGGWVGDWDVPVRFFQTHAFQEERKEGGVRSDGRRGREALDEYKHGVQVPCDPCSSLNRIYDTAQIERPSLIASIRSRCCLVLQTERAICHSTQSASTIFCCIVHLVGKIVEVTDSVGLVEEDSSGQLLPIQAYAVASVFINTCIGGRGEKHDVRASSQCCRRQLRPH